MFVIFEDDTIKFITEGLKECIKYIFLGLHSYTNCVKQQHVYIEIVLFAYVLSNAAVYYLVNSQKLKPVKGSIQNGRRILFVISHPDDECMFFGPAIIHLLKQNSCNVFLLCLSNGDYNNKGDSRKKELWRSCSILGIRPCNIILYKVSLLPDDPKIRWSSTVVGNIILNHIEQLNCDTVVTFDKYGVSSHLNHISVYYGLADLCVRGKIPTYCTIYCLDSVSLCRKYLGLFDLLLSICFNYDWFILLRNDRFILKSAMSAHHSQYVWFRKLFMYFSRYTYVNTYTVLTFSNAEFDIEIEGSLG